MLGQQNQRTATVGGVIGNGNSCAILQILDVLDLAGVGAKRLHMHLAVGNDHQRCLAVFVVAVQIRLVLEEVGVQLLVFDSCIGLHIVAEFLDLQINALGLQSGLDVVEDLGMRHGSRSYLEDFGIGREGQSGNSDRRKSFLQHRF